MVLRQIRRLLVIGILSLDAACHAHAGQALIPACQPGTCTEPFVAQDSALPFLTLQGLVVGQADLQGIPSATVQSTVSRRTAHTDRHGKFRLQKLQVGADTLLITSPAYKPRVVPISVPSVGGLWLFTKLVMAPNILSQ